MEDSEGLFSRRKFLAGSGILFLGASLKSNAAEGTLESFGTLSERIIDIH
jgi:hypothetical protein